MKLKDFLSQFFVLQNVTGINNGRKWISSTHFVYILTLFFMGTFCLL